MLFMQKILSLFLFLSLISCNDGDFEVPSFEFDTSVNTCGTYVLYRTNTAKTEAFILQLNETDLLLEEITTTISIGAENCNYRIFDAAVDAAYFCSDVPPVEPSVIRNWEAVAGDNNLINITSTAVIDEDTTEITGYIYDIDIVNLVLESNDEQIIYETYAFGSVSISL